MTYSQFNWRMFHFSLLGRMLVVAFLIRFSLHVDVHNHFLPKSILWKGWKNNNFTMQKSDSIWMWASISSIVIVASLYSWYDVMKMVPYICGIPLLNSQLQCNREKIIIQVPNWEAFCKIPNQYSLKLSGSSKTKECLRYCHNL